MSDTTQKATDTGGGIEPPLVSINKGTVVSQDSKAATIVSWTFYREESILYNFCNFKGKPKVVSGDRVQEMLRQTKALKDERRATIDGRFEFIFGRVRLDFFPTEFFLSLNFSSLKQLDAKFQL